MHSERDENAVSNRALLANALESVSSKEEKDLIISYRARIVTSTSSKQSLMRIVPRRNRFDSRREQPQRSRPSLSSSMRKRGNSKSVSPSTICSVPAVYGSPLAFARVCRKRHPPPKTKT